MVGGGFFLLLQRHFARVILGLGLLGNGVNLLLLQQGRIIPGSSPVIDSSATVLAGSSDPVPQALILTAIVIGLAMIAFSVGLFLNVGASESEDDQ
jgi:multicomponent Na+:H+ antiporter subunit C